ncbi:MAG: hypothetical protein NT069_30135, partial [Planctomycetota bacterium]|nr:hypothetical protein [Planctomycetota bacterium]
MKRRIGNACSHDGEVKRRVTFTDLAAGCAVGRNAAERRRDNVADGVPTTPRSGRPAAESSGDRLNHR